MSILDIINHFPLDYTCRLMLTHTELPLPDIIKQSGLSSTSTFFRNFSAIKGMTPSQYKERKSIFGDKLPISF